MNRPPPSPRRILIVEDNPNDSRQATVALGGCQAEYSTITAVTPAAALEILAREDPCVLAVVDLDYAIRDPDSPGRVTHEGALRVMMRLAELEVPFIVNSASTEPSRDLPLLAINTSFRPIGLRAKDTPIDELVGMIDDHLGSGARFDFPERYRLRRRELLFDLIKTEVQLGVWRALTRPTLVKNEHIGEAAGVAPETVTAFTRRWLDSVRVIQATLNQEPLPDQTRDKNAQATAICRSFAEQNRLFFYDQALSDLITSRWWR